MSRTRARLLHRTILGAALVLKGLVWHAAPIEAAALLVVGGLVGMHGRWRRVGFAVAATTIWLTVLSDSYHANHFILLGFLSTYAAAIPAQDLESGAELLSMVQVSTVYFWAGIWKLNTLFLTGAVLHYEWDTSWLLGVGSLPPIAYQGLAVATIVGELVLAVGLWSRRLLVPWMLVLAFVLHAGMILTIGADAWTTGELVVFALACASVFPLFSARVGRGPSRGSPRQPRRAATTAA